MARSDNGVISGVSRPVPWLLILKDRTEVKPDFRDDDGGLGEVDGLVSGAVHSTAHTIRPALQVIRTKPNAHAVSWIFVYVPGGFV